MVYGLKDSTWTQDINHFILYKKVENETEIIHTWLCYSFTVCDKCTHFPLVLPVSIGFYWREEPVFQQRACKMFFSCCDGKWPRQPPSRGALAVLTAPARYVCSEHELCSTWSKANHELHDLENKFHTQGAKKKQTRIGRKRRKQKDHVCKVDEEVIRKMRISFLHIFHWLQMWCLYSTFFFSPSL